MPQIGPFSAWVEIEGVPAQEYQVEAHHNGRLVTCWIPSQTGKSFSVSWRNTAIQVSTVGHVSVDGRECGGIVLHAPSLECVKMEGVTGATTVRQFTFSSLTLTDDDSFLGNLVGNEKLGLIEVSIYPIQVTGYVPMPSAPELPEIKIHERSSKSAGTQQVKLAEPKLLPAPRPAVTSRFLGPAYVTFVFKYRPLDILQANGIAAPPPRQLVASPGLTRPNLKPIRRQFKRKRSAELQTSSTPDEDQSDAEEIRILREKLNALEAKRAAKKAKTTRVKEEENIPPLALLTGKN
ncbi:hypothetical protein B0H11DRAFT_1877124 [Mycena galericulata]|nr:hypothetical protein B0H11DRAFT_1877124 [Mycena galericulata]